MRRLFFAMGIIFMGLSASSQVYANDGSDIQSPARQEADTAQNSLGKSSGNLEKMKNDFDSRLLQIESAAKSLGAQVSPAIAQYKKLANESYSQGSHCIKQHSSAGKMCLESLSPNVTSMIASLNTAMAAMGMNSSVTDSCNKIGGLMKALQAGMAGYTAACGTAKSMCSRSCGKSFDAAQELAKQMQGSSGEIGCQALSGSPSFAACQQQAQALVSLKSDIIGLVTKESDKSNTTTVAGKRQLCAGKYAELAASGVASVMNVVNALNQSKSCEEASNAAANNVCSDITTMNTEACKCQIETSMDCICFRNPRTQGCSNALAGMGAGSGDTLGSSGLSSDGTPIDLSSNMDPLGNGDMGPFGKREANSAGGAGAPVGGGSAGLSGGGGGGSGAGSGGGAGGGKGLDTNILGGVGGGGGGAGSRGVSSFNGGGSKYKAYLPGGEKDPNKMAGQQVWDKEVTGQGGKSNWEKVRDRYLDNKATLLNQ